MIILDNTPLLTWELQRCINRLKSVIFSTDMCILQTWTYWKVGPHGTEILRFQMQKWNISTYRAQRVDEKNDAICLVMFTSKVMVIRMSKMAHLMYFLFNTEKNRHSLGKIFKCIWKVLFDPFTKYYGLWSSVLPLANWQHLKIQDFTSSLLTQHFFVF